VERASARGVGQGRVAILRERDVNGTAGARAGGGAGPAQEAGVGRTQGGQARVRVGVAGSIDRLTN
jgi:hypothetical protein